MWITGRSETDSQETGQDTEAEGCGIEKSFVKLQQLAADLRSSPEMDDGVSGETC